MYDFIAFEDFSAPNTLAYEEFRELMDVCFRHASFFSMNRSRWGDSCNDTSLEEELAPFLDRKIETLVWFGYDFRNPPEGCYGDVHVMLYRAEPTAKEILLRYFDDIFLRRFSKGDHCTDLGLTLEDLCFFHQTKLFLGTISHEYILSLEAIHKELADFIKTHGKWKLQSPRETIATVIDLADYEMKP